MGYDHIIIEKKDAIATLWLNRPEVHNAFHPDLINEMTQALDTLAVDTTTRVLILRGQGKSFCAGADLNWMKAAVDYSYEKNLEESLGLSQCLYDLYSFPKPTIAVVHGNVFGGGNGFMVACDFVLAEERSIFSLSEVNLGLVPACISPYILKRAGEIKGKQVMLRGNRMKADQAMAIGMVDEVLSQNELADTISRLIEELKTSGPEALSRTKEIINQVVNVWSLEEARQYTAEWIAGIRETDEAQEGMKAFFEKRKPNWIEP